ncbi:FAD binding domain-containing protein [Fusarium phyllophilum]|uniref:FAD binding domain-containing protein n=1 Tax=Fusarium phyllophilum TaxID=47803 RepID=A0A8H5MLK0_9HYPO|nr:FAD binding domain-containing protein [Fusarium phyllophilum]
MTTTTPLPAVVIVGGGPVGLLLALLLAQKGIRSVVLEKDEALNKSPRAVAFSGAVHHVFQEVGIYDAILQDAAQTPGFCWRKLAEDDGRGGKRLGQKLAEWRLGEPNESGNYNPGEFVLQYPQSKICQLLLDRALEAGLTTFHFGMELYAIDQSKDGVVAYVRSKEGNLEFRGQYLAGCDGGRSVIRRLMGAKMFGHSWAERFLTTDIVRTPPVVEEMNIDYIMNPDYWAISTPLERATPGKRTLWRYSMAITNDDIPDEEVTKPEFINKMLLKHVDGPRPADFEVVNMNLYRMHQLLANTMYRNKCFLAGDAAHLTNPIGGLGLCTGMLDADALGQTFDLALNRYAGDPKAQEECFTAYSIARRRVFQTVVHPSSSASKTRLYCGNPDIVAEEDWYMRTLRNGNRNAINQMHDGLINYWRTNMASELIDGNYIKRTA